ncbi:CaiB/BaiF CoA transferase family protein [Salinispirillum marinum]|uniref:CaiB/BaiF CoA transferase family protein n=2 Tax=Saccharospirillaceae TaxID=255527 RepID=A0ABV8BII3_9GAMM
MTTKPLAGIRVLDLSRILAGPWASQLLADMGAEVIKVEQPGKGDDTRRWGPPWVGDSGEAAYFLSANRGKQSVTIDMAQPAGQRLIRELVLKSDVLIENFKVGGLKKYGLDYDSLKSVNPRLVYCSITGFGQDGPYAQRAGYDFMIQGMGGLMSLTGQPDDMPGGGPVKVGVALTDIFTGMYASNAITAALWQRQTTGTGTHIDLGLLDVQVGVLANQALNYLTSGQVPQRLGNAHPNIVPYQAFATRDGHLILAVGNDTQYQRFCTAAGAPELATDERFSTNALRVANRHILIPLLEPLLTQFSTDEWLVKLEVEGVPCGPINTLDRVFADPHVQYRDMAINRQHASAGEVKLVSNPIRFDGVAMNADSAPPVLGQHTEDVLREVLALDDNAIVRLRDDGVI